jgi:hypothetical protein
MLNALIEEEIVECRMAQDGKKRRKIYFVQEETIQERKNNG